MCACRLLHTFCHGAPPTDLERFGNCFCEKIYVLTCCDVPSERCWCTSSCRGNLWPRQDPRRGHCSAQVFLCVPTVSATVPTPPPSPQATRTTTTPFRESKKPTNLAAAPKASAWCLLRLPLRARTQSAGSRAQASTLMPLRSRDPCPQPHSPARVDVRRSRRGAPCRLDEELPNLIGHTHTSASLLRMPGQLICVHHTQSPTGRKGEAASSADASRRGTTVSTSGRTIAQRARPRSDTRVASGFRPTSRPRYRILGVSVCDRNKRPLPSHSLCAGARQLFAAARTICERQFRGHVGRLADYSGRQRWIRFV